MLNFLIKDWYSNRLVVWFFVGILAFNSALTMKGLIRPREVIGLLCVIASLLPVSFLAREDKFRSRRLVCSLPLTRKEITRYRFLSSWVYAAGLGALAAVPLGINLALRSELSRLFTPGVLLVGLTCISLALALFLPVVIRFGLLGVIIPLVVLQVLGVVLMIVASTTSRTLRISSLVEPLRVALDAAFVGLGPSLYYLAWAALLVILNLISYKLSEWLFARQEC